jgi:hypothetical protein
VTGNLAERCDRHADDLTRFSPNWSTEAQALLREAAERLSRLLAIVDAQAEDEGLWFIVSTAPEAYLQQELRRLHAAIEEPS